jgi:transaldolase
MGTASKALDDLVHQIACQKIDETAPKPDYQSDPLLARLKSLGTELWVDTGDLELAQSIWKSELTALTTNNTLANQVVQKGVMDEVIEETVQKLKEGASGLSREELIMEIGFVINCRIALRLVEAFRVKVSVELHPSVSRDMDKTLYYARRYYKVCPKYFIVKVPLTPEGFLSVRQLRKEGIPINYTLGFSARQNYLAARLSNPNFVNVFLGRLNAVVADNSFGDGQWVGEKVTLATQNALLEVRNQHSGVETRLIAASIRNGDQLETLAGLDVHTIPPPAMKDFQESGRTPDQIENNVNKDLKPELDTSHAWAQRVEDLWKVDTSFKEAVSKLLADQELNSMSGEALVGFFESHKVDLFYPFTSEDLQKIQDHGKIPKLDEWSEKMALDDLMTHSALQSFTKDQDALDSRIQSFLK